ncbi:MAG TPA: hypothetical protein DCK95_05900 [Anaerolineaceae bacterium]|uniref:Exopolyphosphatase n=1 Tax=Anaerolinea thermophila TaxID=167964 RepID=A0A101FYW8_9CHLR|nr:MAG: Exopolyphosphatase [Anaerolinea thermophila]HAF61841.1 hypothetical protein [Anaerolineaceae bacterium]
MNKPLTQTELSDHQKEQLTEVLNVAKTCQYEKAHTEHVTDLAMQIFNQFIPILQLDENARFYLLCAAILHDIGVHTEGTRGHHKTALRIILSTPLLHFDSKERLIIGSIARYHRKALPSIHHSHFAALNNQEKTLVVKLSAILRIADGLDYRHEGRVTKVKVILQKKKVIFQCKSKRNIDKEIASASHKSDLMEKTLNRRIVFETI